VAGFSEVLGCLHSGPDDHFAASSCLSARTTQHKDGDKRTRDGNMHHAMAGGNFLCRHGLGNGSSGPCPFSDLLNEANGCHGPQDSDFACGVSM
jgi:hypothetical protein